MSSSLDYFDAKYIEAHLDYPSLVNALKHAFQSQVVSPVRSQYRLAHSGDSSPELLLMPSWNSEVASVKLTTIFPDNPLDGLPAISGLVLVFDAKNGLPLAVVDAGELTARRTAAASALASSYLSRPDAKQLLIVGTGRLARYLAEAHSVVRPFSRISIWGRDRKKAEQLLADIPAAVKQRCELDSVDDLAVAVAQADVVSLATRATSALINSDWLSPGTHLDLVGGYRPDMREVDDDCIKRASLFADTREGVLAEAGDFIQPINSGLISADDIQADLFDLCCERHVGRKHIDEITLFKSVGAALEDLAAASLLVAKKHGG